MPPQKITELPTPVALVDHKRLTTNIDRMAKKAKEHSVDLRPHIKTHKCIEIGKMQIEKGARGITVSTLEEAEFFARAGFDDITYAVPISRNKIRKVLELSSKVSMNILVDNPTIVTELDEASRTVQSEFNVLVKVDCGYHRCGVDPTSSAALNLVKKIDNSPNLNWKGILTHAGHSYSATSVEEIKKIAKQEQEVMVRFSKILRREGHTPETISIGSTPTITLADSFYEEITEIRPGNYVFHDYTQVILGVCDPSDCALTVLASIIGTYPDRFVIDAGATALSKDQGPTHRNQMCGFGQVIVDYDNSVFADGLRVDSLSQEHAKISVIGESHDHFNISDMIRILPNHSCLTANLFNNYIVVKDEHVIDNWRTRCI
jgi:D-serine deaminase-like pyridoxal phosphate-dependent protein